MTSGAARDDESRLVFANQLRGLAALSVVFNHLVLVYWSLPQVVATATFSPVQPGPPPAYFSVLNTAWFNAGPFGVAVFFLISGLVIPISLQKHRGFAFLVTRAFRIYPTYIAGFALAMASVALSARLWGQDFTYETDALLANAFLIENLLQLPGLDLVNWTLAVEIKFYLLLWLLAPFVRAGRLWPLLATAVLLAVAVAAKFETPWASALAMDGFYVIFMLIGVVFHYHLRAQVSTRAAVTAVLFLAALFAFVWTLTPLASFFPQVTVNYGYALALFALCYALRGKAVPLAVPDFFARISYPLYVVHSLVGYCVLKLLILRLQLAPELATPIAIASVVAVAWGLHRLVEAPTNALGKRLARNIGTLRGGVAKVATR